MANRKSIRKAVRLKRNALSAQEQTQLSNELMRSLIEHPIVKQSTKVALYLANDGELDPMPFIKWCWLQKKQVYLPVLHPFSKGNLLFFRFEEKSEMITNQFGILEPKLNINTLCLVNELDILFTPLVAFDKTGARMGMGGGYYDRTLNSWYEKFKISSKTPHIEETLIKCKPYPIGLAHDCQQVEHITSEYWDIPLPQIITPSQIITQSPPARVKT